MHCLHGHVMVLRQGSCCAQAAAHWFACYVARMCTAVRSQRVGPRVVVLYATWRVLADLARLLQQQEQQKQQELEQQQLGPAATNSPQVGLHV